MDPATIIGIVIGFGAIIGANMMEGGNPGSIMLLPPMILVLGGTLGAGMAGGIMRDTTGIPGQLKRAMTMRKMPADELIGTVVSLAERARREGLLALEEAAKDVSHPFLRKGLQMAIDGTDPDELADILHAEVDAKRKADRAGAKVFTDMGAYAPTIGIIGTVMGLVHVLENLSNPDELGHLIAGAFVATLWGVMSANIIWLPIGNRLKRVSEIECDQMELAIEGILAIQSGANPRVVGQKLKSLLPPGDVKPEKKAA